MGLNTLAKYYIWISTCHFFTIFKGVYRQCMCLKLDTFHVTLNLCYIMLRCLDNARWKVSVMERVVSVSGLPPTPVQLLYPVSRFSNVKSLQHLCRFCIRQLVRIDHIQELPLPKYDSLTPYIIWLIYISDTLPFRGLRSVRSVRSCF